MDQEPPARERYCLRIGLRPVSEVQADGLREVRDEDQPALGALMHSAYAGTVDDAGETEAEAEDEVRKTYAGGYGPLMRMCSRVIERNGHIASAVLVTRYEGRPLIAFTMTHPDFQRQGLAQVLMRSAMNALCACNEQEVYLAVTVANQPALRLYQKLGFEIVKPPPPLAPPDVNQVSV